ncbi:unnamed protein product, partial [Mesorhabditis spiculigera]
MLLLKFIFLLLLFLLLFNIGAAREKCKGNVQYFSAGDYFDADCIDVNQAKDYKYFGNKNTSLNDEPCVPWNRLWQHLDLAGFIQGPKLLTIHVRQTHNFCRMLPMELWNTWTVSDIFSMGKDAMGRLAGDKFPFCLVATEQHGILTAKRCLDKCHAWQECVPSEPPKPRKKHTAPVEPNFNPELFGSLREYFAFNWGTDEQLYSYYDQHQSDRYFSSQLSTIRNWIAAAACVALVLIILYFVINWTLQRLAKVARDTKTKTDDESHGSSQPNTKDTNTKETTTTDGNNNTTPSPTPTPTPTSPTP